MNRPPRIVQNAAAIAASDNCTLTSNALQIESDGDRFGNFCDADFNNDCIVNVVDLGFFRAVFFTNNNRADLNSDGIVNALDLGLFKSLFFATPGPSAVANICL